MPLNFRGLLIRNQVRRDIDTHSLLNYSIILPMTRFVIPLIFIFLAPTTYAQTTTNADSGKQRKESNQIGVYELYPTKNYWTFIKLDTRNGKMWQVQFSIEDNKNSGELIINDTPLVSEEE